MRITEGQTITNRKEEKDIPIMKFKSWLIVLCVALCCVNVTGCKKNKEKISEYDVTIEGIDSDGSRIRDEIEERMQKEMASEVNEYEYKVLLQNAKSFQEILTLNLESRPEVLLARDHMDQAINCGIQIYGDGLNFDHYTILLTKLRQWYFNTEEPRERRQDFIVRSREYHYTNTTAVDEYTCDFDVPDELMKSIEARMEIRRQKNIEEQQNKENGENAQKPDEIQAIAEEGANLSSVSN